LRHSRHWAATHQRNVPNLPFNPDPATPGRLTFIVRPQRKPLHQILGKLQSIVLIAKSKAMLGCSRPTQSLRQLRRQVMGLGLTVRSTRTQPRLAGLLSPARAFSASLFLRSAAGPVNLCR
jgi:hypothetical protein